MPADGRSGDGADLLTAIREKAPEAGVELPAVFALVRSYGSAETPRTAVR